MTGSKIWKTDLQGLIEEAVAPVYVIALAEKIPAKFGDGELEMVQFSVSVTAFNEDGRHWNYVSRSFEFQRYLKARSKRDAGRTPKCSKK
jgi:hypothetical protein